MVFAISQGYMGEMLSGRNKSLKELNHRFQELSHLLGLEKTKNESLEKMFFVLKENLEESTKEKNQAKVEREESQIQIEQLSRELKTLNDYLNNASAMFKVSQEENEKKDIEIQGLLQKLKNMTKDFDLGKYRSEFFGKLKDAIGKRADISIRGDRFVFQSEVLFTSGSWNLEKSGQDQLVFLAKTLKEITANFPKNINWILRIDGHTDKRPIKNDQVRSNWELSSNRAITVVGFLMSQGIPPNRLAATGFGEFQPIDTAETEESYSKNRRIEIKLDQF
jgi:chemotaxis protein MotB